MSSDGLAVAGIVAVLLPTLYFLIASPTFLLRSFDDPVVAWLFRGLLSFHFKLVAIGSALGACALVYAGRPLHAVVIVAIGTVGIAVRRWFLRHVDGAIDARKAGDARATARMRALHRRSMAYNAAQFLTLLVIVQLAFRP